MLAQLFINFAILALFIAATIFLIALSEPLLNAIKRKYGRWQRSRKANEKGRL